MATAIATSIAKQSRRSVRSLSVQEKVHAIDRVHEGESKASVARDIGVPESTLRGWCKGEEKLRGIVARSSGGNSSDTPPASLDDSYDKAPKLTAHTDSSSQNAHKRDYASIDDNLHQSPVVKKFIKSDKSNDVPIIDLKVNKLDETPINFTKNKENDFKSRIMPNEIKADLPAFIKKEESRDSLEQGNVAAAAAAPTLPALAAIASAISNKNQLLYNAYTNGILNDMVPKQELSSNIPLDYSTKVTPRLPRPEVNEALMYWLQAQREQAALPMSPMEARTADTSSWFWKLYKNYGVLPQVSEELFFKFFFFCVVW